MRRCTVACPDVFVPLIEIYRCVYFSKQMPCRYRLRYDRKLCQLSIHFPAFQHASSPFPILPYLLEKAQLKLDLFDRLQARCGCSGCFYSFLMIKNA